MGFDSPATFYGAPLTRSSGWLTLTYLSTNLPKYLDAQEFLSVKTKRSRASPGSLGFKDLFRASVKVHFSALGRLGNHHPPIFRGIVPADKPECFRTSNSVHEPKLPCGFDIFTFHKGGDRSHTIMLVGEPGNARKDSPKQATSETTLTSRGNETAN